MVSFSVRAGTAIVAAGFLAALAGCAQTPMGSAVQVMPGPGKSFDAFATDQSTCKSYAAGQVKGQADLANQQAAGSAILTSLLGAGLGAAIGGATGNAGAGAAIGASGGAAGGAGVAAASSQNAQAMIQVQYDNAYTQCMYSKGNEVPGFAPVMADIGPAKGTYSGPDPALVRSVQNELVRVGYLDAQPDGVLGPRTRAAISSFERDKSLAVNGSVSQHLLAELQATSGGGASAAAAASPPQAPANWISPSSAQVPSAPQGWITPNRTP